eukprot:SAG11_NODE_17160_length_526_cov_1.920375_1_plen_31_part_10
MRKVSIAASLLALTDVAVVATLCQHATTHEC